MFKLRFHGAMWLGSKDQKLREQEKEKLGAFGRDGLNPPTLVHLGGKVKLIEIVSILLFSSRNTAACKKPIASV